MILEWIDYFTTKAPDWARSKGLVYESVALKARLKRQHEAWEPHLWNCSTEIVKFLAAHPESVNIFVLGSGHLAEFPKAVFHDSNRRFFLVDAVHPRAIQSLAQKFPNIELMEVDLSLEPIAAAARLGESLFDRSLIISCNLFSQLPRPFINSTNKGNEVEISKEILTRHLVFLQQTGAPFLLISDYARKFVAATGRLLHWESSLKGLTLPEAEAVWSWSLAPIGEISKEYSVELMVGVWKDSQFETLPTSSDHAFDEVGR